MTITFAETRMDMHRAEAVEAAVENAVAEYADVDPLRGEYMGDGIPRTADGIPYDPETGRTNRIVLTKGGRSYRLLSPADVPTRQLRFLWYPWLRPGLNVLAGLGGSRKSTFAAFMCAQATRGLFTDQNGDHCPKTHVLYISQGEDDVNSILAPRLLAQGADSEYMHIFQVSAQGAFGTETTIPASAKDLQAIKSIASELKPGLIVFDPLSLLVNGDINSYQDVQPALVACNELAAIAGDCAVLGLHHWNKSGGFTGSQKFQDTARSFMEIATDPTDDHASIVTLTKANNSDKPSIRLTAAIVPFQNSDGTTSNVQIIGQTNESKVTVEDVRKFRANGEDAEDLGEIDQWCLDYLRTHGGKALSTEVYEAGGKAGYSRDQLKRAGRRSPYIEPKKDSKVMQGRWCWILNLKGNAQ